MILSENAELAVRLVLPLLGDKTPTVEIIRTELQRVLQMLQSRSGGAESIDEEQLVKYIETRCNVFVPVAATIEDQKNHIEWLMARRADIEWKFWDRYRRYLEDVEQLGPQVVRRLDEVTEQILRRLEDPRRPGEWDRRGMVVGQVQSGKTGNYIGLICKAVDAGYRLIVVLAGTHNSLRSQTQLRLDEGFLGFDTQQRMLFAQDNVRMGVGRLQGARLYHAHSLTSSEERGDFNLRVARNANVMIGGADPVVLVVKKNASVLRNVHKWATFIQQTTDPGSGRKMVRDVPLLLIDDEADSASVNTNKILDDNDQPDPDLEPTRINGLIRQILHSFEKSAYVGYTATPFANIFIAENMVNDDYGKDLFPESFIINLAPPSNYMGPARVFGMKADPAAGITEQPGLPVMRTVDDYQEWMPDGHKKEHVPGPMPASLHRALRSFILTCAARQVRGDSNSHNSMLIHVTRFVAVQARITEQVEDELRVLQQRLRYGDGSYPLSLLEELEEIWVSDFVPTIGALQGHDDFGNLAPLAWEQVREVLYQTASRIEVRKINGTAKDTLQYIEHPDGLSVICIGGDKLSRGLTLSGLSASYYLRASKMYDTLMQMGRWFGYRPGYIDLCRLYTSAELIRWYRDITAADDELRREFEHMARTDATPVDYGLRIRNHPDGLMITAAAKMRSGQMVRVSYSGVISETIAFYADSAINHQNLEATERLIRSIDGPCDRRQGLEVHDNYVWHGVDGDAILEFLSDYVTHEGARTVRSSLLYKYIEARLLDSELTDWTVALISNQAAKAQASTSIADLQIGLTGRQSMQTATPDDPVYAIKRLVSPRDEMLDMSADEQRYALKETQSAWAANPDKSKRTTEPAEPSGLIIRRKIRPSTRGLLVLYPLNLHHPDPLPAGEKPVMGFAISFPESSRDSGETAIEYMVNNIYWKQEFGEDL